MHSKASHKIAQKNDVWDLFENNPRGKGRVAVETRVAQVDNFKLNDKHMGFDYSLYIYILEILHKV